MIRLSKALAQEIASRTMAILPHNINVMDEHGVILASGDPARVGEVHEGAVLAIQQDRVLPIDDAMAARLHGVRPGVNLPLHQQGRIVGVIGITGEPAVVVQLGELVRMTAEMMLEQKALLHAVERDARLYEELVQQLISRREAPDAPLLLWAKRLGVDLSVPLVALVIRATGDSLQQEEGLQALQQLQLLLAEISQPPLLARHAFNEFVLLRPALDTLGRWDANLHRRLLKPQLEELQKNCPLHLQASLGHCFWHEGAVALSYQTACATLQLPVQGDEWFYVFEEQRLPVLLSPLAQGWQAEMLNAPLQRLRQHDRRGELLQTIACWFAQDLNHHATALQLGIHRNTLDYRLRRVGELTRLDLARIEGRVQIYIALQLSRLLEAASWQNQPKTFQ